MTLSSSSWGTPSSMIVLQLLVGGGFKFGQVDIYIGDENEGEETRARGYPNIQASACSALPVSTSRFASRLESPTLRHAREHIQGRVIFMNQRRNLVGDQQRRQVDERVFNGDDIPLHRLIMGRKFREPGRILSAWDGAEYSSSIDHAS